MQQNLIKAEAKIEPKKFVSSIPKSFLHFVFVVNSDKLKEEAAKASKINK